MEETELTNVIRFIKYNETLSSVEANAVESAVLSSEASTSGKPLERRFFHENSASVLQNRCLSCVFEVAF